MRNLILILGIFFIFQSHAHAEIQGIELGYQAGETPLQGYIAYDDAFEGPRPGVLIVHEWWGHNDYVRKRADMLAEMGYTAIALDMYGAGQTAEHPEDAGAFAKKVKSTEGLAKERFQAAYDALTFHETVNPEKIAAIGYCFGGSVVLDMARQGLPLDGVASFHGSLGTSTPAQKGEVQAEVLVLHGAEDTMITQEAIDAFHKEMKSAKVKYKFIAYKGAQHSFTNPDADEYAEKFKIPVGYDEKADKKSWKELDKFLKKVFK